MGINPAKMLKLLTAKQEFENRHPRAASFISNELRPPFEEGTVFEFSITRPGQKTVTTNLKLTAEDIALFEQLNSEKE